MAVVTPYSIAFIKTNLINGLTPRIKVIYNDFQKKWRNGASSKFNFTNWFKFKCLLKTNFLISHFCVFPAQTFLNDLRTPLNIQKIPNFQLYENNLSQFV